MNNNTKHELSVYIDSDWATCTVTDSVSRNVDIDDLNKYYSKGEYDIVELDDRIIDEFSSDTHSSHH